MKKYTITTLLIIIGFVNSNAQSSNDSASIPSPIQSVTKHSANIGGKQIAYTATAGALILKNEKDEPIALFGYTAYTKDGEQDASKRPITFSYNGGPGSSSMWLHMGIMGPKKVVVNDPNKNPPPPYVTEDNTNSILDVSDIVMIDPIGTGLSHAVGKAKNKDFWGVDQDIKSVSFFIKQYVTENDRWQSPKYILGESYGTTRSGGVANYLQENFSMALNGVVLVSSVLNYHLKENEDDITYEMFLPTYAATAWYHNKVSHTSFPDIKNFVQEVRDFAAGAYATALLKGDAITSSEKEVVLAKLVLYTGLSKNFLERANMRVTQPQFTQELLRNEHKTTGRLDSRYTGINKNLLSEDAEYDPQSAAISAAYTATFMNYFYNDLKVPKKYNYHTSARDAEGYTWDWKRTKTGSRSSLPNTSVDLAETMSHNPHLKILVLNGYYDLATPFFATEYTFNHMGLEKEIRDNVTFKYYEAGHMMYINPTSAKQFKSDVSSFITTTSH